MVLLDEFPNESGRHLRAEFPVESNNLILLKLPTASALAAALGASFLFWWGWAVLSYDMHSHSMGSAKG
jgi:hypothetical protein